MTATENILGLSGYDAATLNTVANAVADGLVGPGEWMPLSVRYRVAAKVLDALAEQAPSAAEVDAAALEEGTLTVLREGSLPLDQYDAVREHLKSTRDTRPEAWAEGREMARRILTAARKAQS